MIIQPKTPEAGRLYPPFSADNTPREIWNLPKDKRGYPIPHFVDMRAPYVDGNPDFRMMSMEAMRACINEKLCWICGKSLGPVMCFPAGPMCGINRTSSEPPSHGACAFWAARACPFLAQPKRIRNDGGLPDDAHMAGHGIMRNPGVTMLWHCESYTLHRIENGILFTLGDPLMVQWAREGRTATREEVLESVSTGLPILLEQAAEHDGAPGCFELGRMTERFMQYVPAAPVKPALFTPSGKGLFRP